ncbi:hypothetical protein [Spiribacter pallidus]|uniref:DUF3168 domain-containing protein n=1 Tax=Spiribacter pallidus TaxID=1987936 RepID=A0ABV3TBU0_9GAMM
MDQDDIVDKLVAENRKDPRNKIIIDGEDLSAFASDELDSAVTVLLLSRAIAAYRSGSPSDEHQAVVDAATALCHQVADRVWGECIDTEEDEWQEINISTDWITGPEQEDTELRVVVRQI